MSSKRILSFKYALEGIWNALKEEPNLKFHFSAGFLAIFLGILFRITSIQWAIIILIIGLVISVELTNTAIEAIVDSFTDKTHPGAKLAKDISAGAVLILAITAIVIGVIVYLPYLLKFL